MNNSSGTHQSTASVTRLALEDFVYGVYLLRLICSWNIYLQTNFANIALETIVSVQPKESSGGAGETRESVVFKQADEMLEKLPENFLPHKVSDPAELTTECKLLRLYFSSLSNQSGCSSHNHSFSRELVALKVNYNNYLGF